MTRHSTDPASRRLRNFVLLVVLTVAVPSLLLTGFGLIAMENERGAAKERIKELYRPLLEKLTQRLVAKLKQLPAETEVPLDSLAAWGQRQAAQTGASFDEFVNQHPAALNFFVFDRQGRQLVPSRESPLPTPQGYLPESFAVAQRLELVERKFTKAAEEYRAILVALNPNDPVRCVVQNALARSLFAAGAHQAAGPILDQVTDSCAQFTDAAGYNLALGAHLKKMMMAPKGCSESLRSQLRALIEKLRRPTLRASKDQVIFTARQALTLAKQRCQMQADQELEYLKALSQQETAFAAVAEMRKHVGEQPRIYALRVNGVRQVFVLRGGSTLSGFQLTPAGMSPMLDRLLHELQMEKNLVGRVFVSEDMNPDDRTEAGHLFLRTTDLAWVHYLYLPPGNSLDQMAESRARIYFWALLLLVAALVIGIGRTLVVMVRESRLSRLKTDFVSSVSHELRTPLTSIRMFTETLLLGRTKTKEQERECLETIGRETERLSRLVERILDFSRMEAGRKAFTFRPQNLVALVDVAVAACAPVIEEQQFELSRSLPADLPRVPADPDAMVEVMINLLSNAFKYSPTDKRVELQARVNGAFVELSIRDHGIGIQRADHKRIFEKFYRVDTELASQVPGSGLGLSLVQYILRAHGGEVRVESELGQGSTFTLRLPLAPQEKTKEIPS